MKQSTGLRDSLDVLRYTEHGEHRDTVKRHFIKWMSQQRPPRQVRCEIPSCDFHSKPLIWNGRPLTLILDHINGVNSDNRTENLRFLCPNCNAQQETHGGGNKGKSLKSSGGFARVSDDGTKQYSLPAEAGSYKMNGQMASNFDSTENQN